MNLNDLGELYTPFAKVPRLTREVTITEKIDGTNAAVRVYPDGQVRAASRTRWITPQDDNYGFAKWVQENEECLRELGEGLHFGEWWGKGINRNYAQTTRRFSLFNTHRWGDHNTPTPSCCEVVPVLYHGMFDEYEVMKGVKLALNVLRGEGSKAAPGFMNPEGIMVYHHAAKQYFKKTLEKDDEWKGKSQ